MTPLISGLPGLHRYGSFRLSLLSLQFHKERNEDRMIPLTLVNENGSRQIARNDGSIIQETLVPAQP
jgi:hypothetical protein